MMKITLECHGLLEPLCGAERVLRLDAESATVADVLAGLAAEVPAFGDRLPQVACARGDVLLPRNAAVGNGDRLALIPPVSGG